MLCFAYLIVLDIIRGEILHNLVIIVCCGGAVTKETDFVDCISPHCPIHQHCRCRFCLVNVLLWPTNHIIANHYIAAVFPQLLVSGQGKGALSGLSVPGSLINAPDRCSSYIC